MERVVIKSDAAQHVQAYLDYVNIVGNADGGKMMSEKEFEEYKKQVREARKNRLYVVWRNPDGQDCRTIGPASSCFCGHRYKDHFFDNVVDRKINCRTSKCICKMFSYVPIFGSQDLKCLCKHSYTEHHPNTKKCTRPGCKGCQNFTSKHGCNCPYTYDQHQTIFESREEREAQGRPVDPKWMQDNNMVGGMGGLTQGFMDLVEGEDKNELMDPNAIMDNLQGGNMLMGSQMKAIAGGQGKGPKAITGGKGPGNQVARAIPTQNALSLFCTPHNYTSASSSSVTKQMRSLKLH